MAFTLFKTSMKGFIQQESRHNYRQQLAEKKAHLIAAKDAYQGALKLVNQFNQKVIAAKENLESTEKKLIDIKDVSRRQGLERQKKQYERFTATVPEKLAPLTLRLEQLAENILRLKKEISAIIEQAGETANTNAPGAGQPISKG